MLQLEKAHRSNEGPGQLKERCVVCFSAHWVAGAVRGALLQGGGLQLDFNSGQAILVMEGTGFPGRGFALGLIVRGKFLPLLRSPEKEILQPPQEIEFAVSMSLSRRPPFRVDVINPQIKLWEGIEAGSPKLAGYSLTNTDKALILLFSKPPLSPWLLGWASQEACREAGEVGGWWWWGVQGLAWPWGQVCCQNIPGTPSECSWEQSSLSIASDWLDS